MQPLLTIYHAKFCCRTSVLSCSSSFSEYVILGDYKACLRQVNCFLITRYYIVVCIVWTVQCITIKQSSGKIPFKLHSMTCFLLCFYETDYIAHALYLLLCLIHLMCSPRNSGFQTFSRYLYCTFQLKVLIVY